MGDPFNVVPLSPHLSNGARETCSISCKQNHSLCVCVMGEGHCNLTPIYTWIIDLNLPDHPFPLAGQLPVDNTPLP